MHESGGGYLLVSSLIRRIRRRPALSPPHLFLYFSLLPNLHPSLVLFILPTIASARDLFSLFCGVSCNAFTVSDGELSPVGAGVYPKASLFNHSCAPNVVAIWDGAKVNMRTLAAVAAGDELCIAYVDPLLPTARRRADLREVYNFDCGCLRCVATTCQMGQLRKVAACGGLDEALPPVDGLGDEVVGDADLGGTRSDVVAAAAGVNGAEACDGNLGVAALAEAAEELERLSEAYACPVGCDGGVADAVVGADLSDADPDGPLDQAMDLIYDITCQRCGATQTIPADEVQPLIGRATELVDSPEAQRLAGTPQPDPPSAQEALSVLEAVGVVLGPTHFLVRALRGMVIDAHVRDSAYGAALEACTDLVTSLEAMAGSESVAARSGLLPAHPLLGVELLRAGRLALWTQADPTEGNAVELLGRALAILKVTHGTSHPLYQAQEEVYKNTLSLRQVLSSGLASLLPN